MSGVEAVSIGQVRETDKIDVRVTTKYKGESLGAFEVVDNLNGSVPVDLAVAVKKLC